MHRIELRRGHAAASLAPALGGALAGFWWKLDGRRIDWLRPAGDAPTGAEDASCFPLVPFSNRVRDGRFAFGGRTVALDRPGDRHFLHGHGWRAPWTVGEGAADRVTLSYQHAADAWPWPYRAEQRFALSEEALSVELTLTNLSDAPMPCGIGLHPYFPRDAATRLTARVDAMWETDAAILPTRLSPCAPQADPSRGLSVDGVALDNAFTGFDGSAEIAWADRTLRLEADAPLRVLVVYTPPGESFFCAEPVSNITDALNLPDAENGLVVLAPGETIRARVRFVPRLLTRARGPRNDRHPSGDNA